MADPSRAEISADVTLPTYKAELYLTGSWTDVSTDITAASHSVETSGDVSGIAFGTIVSPRASVAFNADGLARSWELTPIRLSYGFASSDKLQRFHGVITGCTWDGAGGAWECRGWDALIEGQEIRSPLFRRRPIATATTVSSIEDPANGGYAAGILNYILWSAGGRPYEQAASYASALWYYGCTHAVIAPEFTWVSGEDAWQAAQRFVRAAGGQLYQDDEGTIRYVDPLTMVSGSPAFTFTDAVQTAAQRESNATAGYGTPTRRASVQKSVTGVTCAYLSRLVGGVQVVYEDKQPRRVGEDTADDDTLTHNCDTTLPLFSIDRVERDAAVVRTAYAPTTAEVTIGISSSSAQRVTVQVVNTLSEPVQLDGIRVWGRPVSAGEEGTAGYAAGGGPLNQGRILALEDNPWIQSARHARQLCRMAFDFHATAGEAVTLPDVAYDPDRYVGEIVAFTYDDWNYTAAPHRIVAIRGEDGAFMEVDITPINGLLTRDEVWIVGTAYAGGDTRELSY
jgi:hypothetical protein